MYRGTASVPPPLGVDLKRFAAIIGHRGEGRARWVLESDSSPEKKASGVMLEIVAVIDIPTGDKGSFFVSSRKKQPDMFFTPREV
ncbi:hypothetical protein L484_025545 [Morus notabilis]|uniref:GRDP C2 domain-containing protein n=1 Tax=Morus notabilis TaxID=981085 RepID=W9RZM8_9ROSA|nr:hypothetical protein L484_025545 [Morus notabilis]